VVARKASGSSRCWSRPAGWAATILLLSCLTGLVYAFSPQIHDDLYQSQLYVSQPHEGAPRPVSEQVNAALVAHPEGALRSVITPSTSDRTTRVNLAVPSLRGAGDEAQSRSVFLDPYPNFITGELTAADASRADWQLVYGPGR
jgi:uncharacterized iron-regulated membrane protein